MAFSFFMSYFLNFFLFLLKPNSVFSVFHHNQNGIVHYELDIVTRTITIIFFFPHSSSSLYWFLLCITSYCYLFVLVTFISCHCFLECCLITITSKLISVLVFPIFSVLSDLAIIPYSFILVLYPFNYISI